MTYSHYIYCSFLKQHNKRQVQYMAGHKYISSTEAYVIQEMDTLQDELSKHHPFVPLWGIG